MHIICGGNDICDVRKVRSMGNDEGAPAWDSVASHARIGDPTLNTDRNFLRQNDYARLTGVPEPIVNDPCTLILGYASLAYGKLPWLCGYLVGTGWNREKRTQDGSEAYLGMEALSMSGRGTQELCAGFPKWTTLSCQPRQVIDEQ